MKTRKDNKMELLTLSVVLLVLNHPVIASEQSAIDEAAVRVETLLSKYRDVSLLDAASADTTTTTTVANDTVGAKQGFFQKLSNRLHLSRGSDNNDNNKLGSKEMASLIAIYKQLNDELVNKLPEDSSVESNYQQILDWYTQIYVNGDGGQLPKSLVDHPGLKLGLRQLVSLAKLGQDSVRCSKEGERILSLNEQLTNGRALSYDETLRNRIDNIVRYFLVEHERACRGVHAIKYEQLLVRMNSDEKGMLFDLLSDKLIADIILDKPDAYIEAVYDGKMVPKDGDNNPGNESALAQVLATELNKLASVQKKANFYKPRSALLDRIRFNKVFDVYLVKPCKKYVKLLGPNVYEPWLLDLEVRGPQQAAASTEMTADVGRFTLGWSRFEICRFVVKRADEFKTKVRAILTASSKKRSQ